MPLSSCKIVQDFIILRLCKFDIIFDYLTKLSFCICSSSFCIYFVYFVSDRTNDILNEPVLLLYRDLFQAHVNIIMINLSIYVCRKHALFWAKTNIYIN